jgi:type III restriction enzyme
LTGWQNYTASNGIIRRIFDEEYEKLKKRSPYFSQWNAEEVRSAYFAEYRNQAIDTLEDNEGRQSKEEREAEKAAFELIMQRKERLLAFYDGKDELKKTSFIFAHSALKEGWDNPNVFQICTLRQTTSEMRKRQEIGRGLRLAVNQEGVRSFDEDVNILSVIANESYQSYAARLQSEYVEAGQAAPPPPTNPGKTKAHRNDAIFEGTQAFKDFWAKLQRHTRYCIHVDTDELVERCVERINNRPTPQATIVVEKGTFVVTEYRVDLVSLSSDSCKLKITIRDTLGYENIVTQSFDKRADLPKLLKDDRLRGYKIVQIIPDGDAPRVVFGNGEQLFQHTPIRFQSEQGQRPKPDAVTTPKESYPVFNLIDRAAKDTGLTRPTINRIFRSLTERKKQSIFANPKGLRDVSSARSITLWRIISLIVSSLWSTLLQQSGGMNWKTYSLPKKSSHKKNWCKRHPPAFMTKCKWTPMLKAGLFSIASIKMMKLSFTSNSRRYSKFHCPRY